MGVLEFCADSGQSGLRALGDLFSLVLGEDGHHLEHRLVGVLVVAADELHVATEKSGDECHVPAEPVELGYYELGSLLLVAKVERRLKLRPILMALAALHLHTLTQKLIVANKPHDKISLGGEPQSAHSLLLCGHSKIRHDCHVLHQNAGFEQYTTKIFNLQG